jgi:hypothetical protein
LEDVTFPSNLQSLTFGFMFNQSLEGVTLPTSLRSLVFGEKFNQSLLEVTLPGGLQSLTLGRGFLFMHSLKHVTSLGNLHTLACGSVSVSSL